ncbi:MAG: iron-containing alcohol dehydrogenase [Clostridiales bacterium]|nr:iron-containing alcohol dehydrogenase [Clostridiales bacterium]
MRFYDPTNVYLEKNCVQNHKKELLSLGTRAFIITGRHSAKINGSLDDVLAVLNEASVPYSIFDEIEENPSVETVARAAEIGKEFQADFVIGIGGGSPMDASKAIALLIANPKETSDCFYVAKDLKALPVVAIPTTCGTGSEVTAVSVLTRHHLKTKKSIAYKIFPELSLIDGKYLAKASQKILISTSVDALAHLAESYLSTSANLYNRMFSEYGLKLWKDVIPVLSSEKEPDEEMYEKMMLVSTIAGMAIAQTGTSLPHALSYRITYTYGVAHGKACGIFLAAYMKEYAKNCPEDIEHMLSLLGFDSLEAFGSFLQDLLGTVPYSRYEL